MYQSFIGLEIHVQLQTKTKVFCECPVTFGDEPNTNICPVCLGYPGVLPSLNREAITLGYLLARALNCQLAPVSSFDRKNYFYPDLPKNYQITQYYQPLGTGGYIDLEFRKKKKRVRIHQIHLEEDAGKMIHAGDMSLLDYNRAGTPLLEIVTEPDLEIGEEAELLLQEMRRIVQYLGVSDGNMEEGSLRCDANVSVNLRGQGLGQKVEIKNLNSSRFVRKALTYEIARHQEILDRGGTVTQETRLWNENRDQSSSMRSKELAHDYRYFPEPDLPPFRADEDFLEGLQDRLVELPAVRRARFREWWGFSASQADFLCDEKSTADFFEAVVDAGGAPDQALVWLAGDVRKILNRTGGTLSASPLTPQRLAELLNLLAQGTIHGKIAKQTLEQVFLEDKNPLVIIQERGWKQLSTREELEPFLQQVLKENLFPVEEIRQGETKPLGFLMGKVMKATGGRAEPGAAQALLQEMINAPRRVSSIQVLSFGGAIAGVRREDGLIEPGDLVSLARLFEADPDLPDSIVFDEVRLGQFLSEEITPADWAALVSRIAETLDRGGVQGIVIAHGTDTLAYTASLVHWFFADTPVPIVLTAGEGPPEENSPGGSGANLRSAVICAAGGSAGVHVVYGDDDFLPLNLRFERIDSGGANSFRTWNPEDLTRSGPSLAPVARSSSCEDLTRLLEEVLGQTCIVRVYPGMRGDILITLMDAGIRAFVLEIFDRGTASLREGPFSLRGALEQGRERGILFFCTSQQEGVVDFSEYVTAHALWREGAVPMGGLTTESAFTRLVVAQLEVLCEGETQSREAQREGVLALMDV
ncbi:aspartyl/glutamyl-tRNA(Asn/Gln) amidotransferase subunit B [Alkalispirochaeta americana]|uniref:Aspartyl/glutamyl-tRNA(Asn/Gln) amidotransferase subunit B n=1 Tax=Alkalispirochaeta americana TaxID=159291 RepID=A0A1N6QAQ4_9SPIO|nr:Asp-tRNA(Asn)/Glu-tRNA(Gln) amidotransferase subunit GatB [Alkalispirochaeta americana]SIQ13657.1 aspartyl/glutamyl-tRNA(Asn/Gln) amidotransferase subunit B [Alkalispirochaeta americana]